MKYYINTFLIYAVFGFIIETFMKYVFFPKMANGSLHGPWIPIYGIGCILIILSIKLINKLNISSFLKNIILFVSAMVLLSLIEFIGGHFLEITTHKVYWNYSSLKFNLGHYVSLEIALVWGIISLIIKYTLKLITDKINKKTPSFITYLMFFIFLFDLVLSSVDNLLK